MSQKILLYQLVLSISFLFIVHANLQGQDHTARQIPQAEFGFIPDSLFRMGYSSHPYLIVYKSVSISFEEDEQSIIAVLDHHIRIKIFDGEHQEASLVTIPYYFADEVETIGEIRGRTYTPDGEQTELTGEQVRTVNLNNRYNLKEFTMPGVEDGAVVEYAYRIKRRYIEELPDFYLSHRVPVNIAKVTIEYPRYLRYEVDGMNFEGQAERIEEKIDTSSVPRVFSIPQPEPLTREHWIAMEVPAVEEVAYISAFDDYRGKLKFRLSEFGIPRQKLENSWELTVARMRKNQNPLKMINRYERAGEIGARIAVRQTDLKATQDSIFRYLNGVVKYDGNQSSYSELPDTAVLEGKPADQAAINQTLIAMLRGAGIDAKPLLISTRRFGRINTSYPSLFQFNGLLVYSVIEGEEYFMDGSFPHSQPNLIPVETFNEIGLLFDANTYKWIEIKPALSLFDLNVSMHVELTAEGALKGSMQADVLGYPAQLVRREAAQQKPPSAIIAEIIFDGYTNIDLDRASLENTTSYDRAVELKANFRISDYATSFQEGLEYRPMIVGYLAQNPFNSSQRNLPVTLDAPENISLAYELTIPETFHPPSGYGHRSVELPGATLKEDYEAGGNKITYRFDINISRKHFESGVYPQLLSLYERWVELSNLTWLIEKE